MPLPTHGAAVSCHCSLGPLTARATISLGRWGPQPSETGDISPSLCFRLVPLPPACSSLWERFKGRGATSPTTPTLIVVPSEKTMWFSRKKSEKNRRPVTGIPTGKAGMRRKKRETRKRGNNGFVEWAPPKAAGDDASNVLIPVDLHII